MYNYSELSEKTTEQLRSIAAEMGMKKTESADSDNLINYILDEQAINYASTASEKRRKLPHRPYPGGGYLRRLPADVQQAAAP